MPSEHQPRLTRRELIELGLAAGLTAGLSSTPATATSRKFEYPRGAKPRNIIFMISDGMSLGVPSLAEPFARLVRERGTRWYELLQTPGVAQGLIEMHALDTMVPDSASAATAWASGSRVFNGAVNTLPDGEKLTPIAPLARTVGRRVGLVTTTRITHATPACFASIQASRDDEHLIAPQYLDSVDVLLGGGREFFDAGLRSDKHDLIGEFSARGYAYWTERREVRAPGRPEKVLGLFENGHLPYTIDHNNQPEIARRVPTLAEMTRAALDILAPSEHGFLLQVEGGRVDHAAHANDAATMLWDQLAFDDAIDVVLRFVENRPDTLVVVTSDHGNANPGLNGMGDRYRNSSRCFERLKLATASYGQFFRSARDSGRGAPAPREINQLVQASFGFALDGDEVDALHEMFAGRIPGELQHQHRNWVGVLGQILGNHTGVGWTGVTHTEDFVLATAFGPGAEDFAGLLRNTDVYGCMTALLGIQHRNPSMSTNEAERYASHIEDTQRPHWA